MIDADARSVVHHRRADWATETRIVREGGLAFDPPGVAIEVAELFAAV